MPADLTALVADLGRASVAGLWLPLAGWTLVATLALLADRWMPLLRPRVRAALLTIVLIALPLGLALRALPTPMPEAAARTAPALFVLPLEPAPLSFDASPRSIEIVAPAPPVWPLVSGWLALLALGFAVCGIAYVALSAWKLARWSRSLTDLPDESARASRLARALGAPPPVRVRIVADDVTPCTFGIARSTIVLPARLDPDAQVLALRHEIAHVRHGDAPAHLLALTCSALIAWHPLAHLVCRRATLRREQAADAFALDGQSTHRGAYARLLTRFSSAPTLAPALAVPRHHLHNRLTAMTRFIRLTSPGRALPLTALLVLIALIAIPLRAQEKPLQEILPTTDVVQRAPDLMPNWRDGMQELNGRIVYPPQALEQGIGAFVMVRFVVDERGRVVEPEIVLTRRADLSPSAAQPPAPLAELFEAEAVRALQATTFRPGEQRGELERARMTWGVEFTIDDEGEGRTQIIMPGPASFDEPVSAQPGRSGVIDEVFVVVDTPPQMLPSQQGAFEMMEENLVYPPVAREAGLEGRVIVQFVVDETGAVTQPVVVRGIGGGADEEAIRLLNMLRFSPGTQRGQPVKVQMTLPVTFRLGGTETGSTRQSSSPTGGVEAYDRVDTTPRMLPSQAEAMRAMQAAVEYPSAARQAGIEGRVIVQFVVDETGAVTDPFVVRGIGGGADEEAIRAVQTLRFEPAQKDGKAVKVNMTLPVTFRLGGTETGSASDRDREGIERLERDIQRSSTPSLLMAGRAGAEPVEETAARLRDAGFSLPIAVVEGRVGASGTTNVRIVESDCHLQDDAIRSAAATVTQSQIGGDGGTTRFLMVCPLVETGGVPDRVRRALEQNLDESHQKSRFPTSGPLPLTLAEIYGSTERDADIYRHVSPRQSRTADRHRQRFDRRVWYSRYARRSH